MTLFGMIFYAYDFIIIKHEITDRLWSGREDACGVHVVPDPVDLSDGYPMIAVVTDETLLFRHN